MGDTALASGLARTRGAPSEAVELDVERFDVLPGSAERPAEVARDSELGRTIVRLEHQLDLTRRRLGALRAALRRERGRAHAAATERDALAARLRDLEAARLELQAALAVERRAAETSREQAIRAGSDVRALRRQLTGLAGPVGISAEYLERLERQLREHRRLRARLNAELRSAQARARRAEGMLADAGVRPDRLRPAPEPARSG